MKLSRFKADPNHIMKSKDFKTKKITPFMVAAKKGDIQLVDLFLKFDIKINQKDSEGRNCVFHAISKEKGDNADVIDKLIEYGADINECDNIGRSSLMSAANKGMRNTVEVLLKHKSNIDFIEKGTGSLLN